MTVSDDNLHEVLLRLFDGKENMAKRAIELMNDHKSPLLVSLLEECKLPENPMSDSEIRLILFSLSLMDSNNSPHFCGVGEREGRVVSRLVSDRHSGFAHGIGRSGDLMEVQPKSLGSAILQRLTNKYALHALWACGLRKSTCKKALVLPCATGMAIMLTLSALKKRHPGKSKVLWLRCDQKSAMKAVSLAGLELVVVENRLSGDAIETDLVGVSNAVSVHGVDNILCILSTTSCFAPRLPDDVVGIARLCASRDICHVVNNAYGLQSNKAVSMLNNAVITGGRLDAFIQSTDKNFMVPVGGAIVAGPDATLINSIGMVYPGRASMSPILDMFITLLGLGRPGIQQMLQERRECFEYFQDRLKSDLPSELRLLETPRNDISMAVAVNGHDTLLGSRLFQMHISGARVSVPGQKAYSDGGVKLESFGSHISNYPHAYLNVASAIGQSRAEIDRFMTGLRKAHSKLLPRS